MKPMLKSDLWLSRKPRRAQSTIGRCLLIASLWLAVRTSQAETPMVRDGDSGRLLSDTSGRISEILLHFDEDLDAELGRAYCDLFNALEGDVTIRVLCSTEAAARRFAAEWGDAATAHGRNVDVINVGMKLSIWSRDRCIPRTTGGVVYRAPSFVPTASPYYEFEKQNDLRSQRMLFRGLLGPSVLRSWLHLEGGNVVANDRHVFIGANVLEENDSDPGDPQLEAELNRVCGRPWKLIGGDHEELPWDHVDMYLTPIGQDTVLVASATAGRAFYMAHCDEAGRGSTDEPERALDEIAEQVRRLGYRVLRIPAVFHAEGDWVMTYNNVLMESRGGRNTVIMPRYNVPEMDDAAASAYARLGYDVRTVDVTGIYEFGGALRCVVNVLARTDDVRGRQHERGTPVARRGRLRLHDVSTFVPRRVTRIYGHRDGQLPDVWTISPQADTATPAESAH